MTALDTDEKATEERHLPKLAALCDQVAAIITGKAAAELDVDDISPDDAIAVLPSWVWIIPKIDVGRKGRGPDGELYPMPSRIVWSTSPILVLGPGQEAMIDWQIIGLGHDESGSVHVRRNGDTVLLNEDKRSVLLNEDKGVQTSLQSAGVLPPVLDTFSSNRQIGRFVRALIRFGEGARWELLTGLESFTMNRLTRANSIVAAELAEHSTHSLPLVLDEIAIEDLLAKMLYGENGSSVISRMVDRAIDPKTFRKVDPMHYFAVGVRARAEEAVRQRIGDPKIGPKIRRVASKSKATTMQELLDEYRELYPRDSLAMKRAVAALTAGPEVTAYQKMFHDQIAGPADGGDEE